MDDSWRYHKDEERDLQTIERLGDADLPVCVAKTRSSLSDDPRLKGRPKDFEITVADIRVNAGPASWW